MKSKYRIIILLDIAKTYYLLVRIIVILVFFLSRIRLLLIYSNFENKLDPTQILVLPTLCFRLKMSVKLLITALWAWTRGQLS